MEVIVKKWGNSAAVRIPSAVMQAAELTLEQPVDVRAESGRVVIEPTVRKQFDIRKLVRRINRKNRHAPVDFGKPRGREVW
jgi:antitoxin MazE